MVPLEQAGDDILWIGQVAIVRKADPEGRIGVEWLGFCGGG